jgi:hypothetical protein
MESGAQGQFDIEGAAKEILSFINSKKEIKIINLK